MIKNIYVSWKKQSSTKRYIIAQIKRDQNILSFEYLPDFKKAKKEGFDFFFGFKDEKKMNSNEISNLLSLRIISKERPDRNEFLKFWEATNVSDTFDLLALTQGKSQTDNFEFLADYSTDDNKNLNFVTDLSGVTNLQLKAGSIKKSDILVYKREKDNDSDDAVAVYVGNNKIGYIKQIHCRIFHSEKKLNLTIKAIDENGFIKQIYIKVEANLT